MLEFNRRNARNSRAGPGQCLARQVGRAGTCGATANQIGPHSRDHGVPSDLQWHLIGGVHEDAELDGIGSFVESDILVQVT